MEHPSVVIIGGGLAGLSAGCYARASGFRTQIVEHHALGGVCTAWQRETDYGWWARLGARYAAEKERAGRILLEAVDRSLPGVAGACRMTDVATPLTYWTTARSWRGAYEGWMPSAGSVLPPNLPHRLQGLDGMYLAGQWVEAGGGVPLACTSGRRAVQVLCADRGVPFVTPPRPARGA
jgi:phytoene dehydrogenase-like protein